MCEPDLHGIGRPLGPAIRPFDRDDAVTGDELVEPEIRNLHGLEAIEVHVVQRQAMAGVFLDDRERRARDIRGLSADAAGEAANEGGLARAELAEEQDDITGAQRGRKALSGGGGFVFVCGEQLL